MKKHPIDELFEKKLTGFETKPSNEAWAKIQGRTTEKRRVLAGWIWYAAAGLSLIFVTGYIVWQTEIGKEKSEQTIAVKAKVSPESGRKEVLKHEQVAEQTVSPTVNEPQTARIVEDQKRLVRNSIKVKSGEDVEDQIKNLPKEENTAKQEVAKIEPPEVIIPSVNSNREVADVQRPTSITPTIVAESRKPENRVVLVTVEEPVSETDDKAKTSKFSRVLRQLRNVREGERVDWNEMGVNPKSIFARADNEGETKNSDNHKSKK